MNHDYAHCMNFNDHCPKECFRAQLERDLRQRTDMVGVLLTYTNFALTDECLRWKKENVT